jgi:hypothetical protein
MQVGINPTMAVYTIVLGGACAVAAYSERYRRDQDDIDDRLKERYSTTMKEQQAKIPQITQAIRGQDRRLEGTMNQWVWGGKAALPVGGPTGRGYQARVQSGVPTHEESDSGKATQQEVEEEAAVGVEDESQLSRKERKRRRKERKELKRQQEQEAEQRRWETQRQKLVVQSVAAGATIGAVAVAASVFLGNTRK